jgi:hypothetical protein
MKIYVPPILESHPNYVALTGISLPIGTNALGEPVDFLENMDFMEQQYPEC